MRNVWSCGLHFLSANLLICGILWVSPGQADQTVRSAPPEHLEIAYRFSHEYADVLNVIRALFGRPTEFESENALSMYNQLQNCNVTENAAMGLFSISGPGCKINYKIEQKTEDLGLNENGDPVSETTTNESLQILDQPLIEQSGLKGWTISRMERRDTLVSTPAHALITSERMYVVTAAGREVEIDKKARLYTNMENQEETYFNVQTFDFKDFIVGYNIKVELTEEGALKQSEAKINGETVPLDEVIGTFTPAFVGVTNSSRVL